MNHKRGKPKNARAGCLMCKPNKANGANKKKLGHSGFGKLRSTEEADAELEMFGDDAVYFDAASIYGIGDK